MKLRLLKRDPPGPDPDGPRLVLDLPVLQYEASPGEWVDVPIVSEADIRAATAARMEAEAEERRLKGLPPRRLEIEVQEDIARGHVGARGLIHSLHEALTAAGVRQGTRLLHSQHESGSLHGGVLRAHVQISGADAEKLDLECLRRQPGVIGAELLP